MKSIKLFAAFTLLALAGTPARSDFIAYDVTSGLVGNQTGFPGSIGMDFDVLSPIFVNSLGVFDSGGDGLASSKTVYLYNRDNGTLVTSLSIPAGTGAVLVNGSRFVPFTTQVFLQAGFRGSIVSEGFNAADPNYNTSFNPTVPSTLDSGGGLIAFVGTGRFGDAGVYPTNVDSRPQPNPYAAGTFRFEAIPEPSSTVLMGIGLVGLLFGLRERARLLRQAA